jgi:hypothetical protein
MTSTDTMDTLNSTIQAEKDLLVAEETPAALPIINQNLRSKEETVCCVKPPSFLWFLKTTYPENLVIAESKSMEAVADEEAVSAPQALESSVNPARASESSSTTGTEVQHIIMHKEESIPILPMFSTESATERPASPVVESKTDLEQEPLSSSDPNGAQTTITRAEIAPTATTVEEVYKTPDKTIPRYAHTILTAF